MTSTAGNLPREKKFTPRRSGTGLTVLTGGGEPPSFNGAVMSPAWEKTGEVRASGARSPPVSPPLPGCVLLLLLPLH